MSQSHIVAAIDIGSETILGAVAKISPNGEITPLALAETPSKGVKKGGITNIAMVQHAIDSVFDDLQNNCKYHIYSVIASLSGASIMGHNAEGSAEVKGIAINEAKINQAIAIAKDSSIIDSRQLLHLLRQDFIVDQQTDIENPLGLMGEQLTARMHIISAAKTAYYNLLQTFSHRDIGVEYVVATGLASALACTTKEERELGICVLDIGAGTTDITIIKGNTVRHTEVIPVAGNAITNDVAFYTRSSSELAEEIKRKIDISSTYPNGETLNIQSVGTVAKSYSKQGINEVMRERCTQIVEFALHKIHKAGAEAYFPGGIVICGGSANVKGLETFIMQQAQTPVRKAIIHVDITGNEQKDSRFAALMGLFLCSHTDDYTRVMTSTEKTGIMTRFMEFCKRLRKHF